MTVLEIEGRRVQVGDEFLRLSPEEQEATVEEIARSLPTATRFVGEDNSLVGQLNAGIAQTVGGAVDFLNPLDNLGVTGSARDGLETGMRAIGADVATEDPQTVLEGVFRGTGNAAGAAPTAAPVAALAGRVSAALPVTQVNRAAVANVADDAYAALTSKSGVAVELGAGAVAGGAEQATENQGAPDWVQQTAAMLAPLGLAIVPATMQAGRSAAQLLPGVQAGGRVVRDLRRGFAPMTDEGSREGAAARLRDLVGGEDRAAELAKDITPNSEFGLSPAQQTGDPNLIGLEESAMAESPVARERILQQRRDSEAAMVRGVRSTASQRRPDIGSNEELQGNVADARAFFRRRLGEFGASMQSRIDAALGVANETVRASGPQRRETANSEATVSRLKAALDDQLNEERALWAAVPQEVRVRTDNASGATARLLEDTPWAQRRDVWNDLRDAFGANGRLGDETSVRELHGLYSALRQVAREASSGTAPNSNRARIANVVAEAILKDLEAVEGVSQPLADARAFSRALHEKFDTGAVGRILKRSVAGDEAMAPETALSRTIGRGGADAFAADADIRAASYDTGSEIQDYLRHGFSRAILSDSDFTPGTARTWLRNNVEVLSRYPGLNRELRAALSNRQSAQLFSERLAARTRLGEGGQIAEFTRGKADQAVLSIISADDPIRAARSLAASARKDPTGKASAGLKSAFSVYLTEKPERFPTLLSDPKLSASMRMIFTKAEMNRINVISRAMRRATGSGNNVGAVLNSPANRIVEYLARYVAVQSVAGKGNSAGASLQIANMASGRAKDFVQSLTNDGARQMLMDAIEDPALMRVLLKTPASVSVPGEARSRLAPYLVGGVASHEGDDQ